MSISGVSGSSGVHGQPVSPTLMMNDGQGHEIGGELGISYSSSMDRLSFGRDFSLWFNGYPVYDALGHPEILQRETHYDFKRCEIGIKVAKTPKYFGGEPRDYYIQLIGSYYYMYAPEELQSLSERDSR